MRETKNKWMQRLDGGFSLLIWPWVTSITVKNKETILNLPKPERMRKAKIENQIMKVEMKRSRTIQRKETTMASPKPDSSTHQPVRMSMNTPSATCEGGRHRVGLVLWWTGSVAGVMHELTLYSSYLIILSVLLLFFWTQKVIELNINSNLVNILHCVK